MCKLHKTLSRSFSYRSLTSQADFFVLPACAHANVLGNSHFSKLALLAQSHSTAPDLTAASWAHCPQSDAGACENQIRTVLPQRWMTEKNDRDVHLCAQHKHRVSLLRSAFCAGLSQTQGKATARLQSACSARYAAWQVCDAHHQHWPVPACHRCVAHLLSTVRRQAEGRSANELQSACFGRYAARQVCDARHKRWPVPAVTPTTHALTKQHFLCGSSLLIL